MAEAICIGDPAIEIRVRRHSRARRMVLRVSLCTATPVLTLPPSASLLHARAFALDQEGWLRRSLANAPGRTPVRAGANLPFRGGVLTLVSAERGRTTIADGALQVPGPAAQLPARVGAFLREAARQRCVTAADAHARRLGLPFRRLTMRDTRGRWGSCTANGDLMFCWRLILAPDPVLDYVAAHEVAHLAEMNHGSAFWAVVAQLCPDFRRHREWLRSHGPSLMAYDFSAAAPVAAR